MTAHLSSALRAVQGEAVAAERSRLAAELDAAIRTARSASGATAEGRLWYGLERARLLLGKVRAHDDGPWSQWVGGLSTAVDSINVGVQLEPETDGSLDPMPVRLEVADGGDCSTATAYLDPDETDRLAALLVEAAATARARAVELATPPELTNRPDPTGPPPGRPLGPIDATGVPPLGPTGPPPAVHVRED